MYTLVHFYDAAKKIKKPVPKKVKRSSAKKTPTAKKSNQLDVPKSALFERNKALEQHYRNWLLNIANKVNEIVRNRNNPDSMISSLRSYSKELSDYARTISKSVVYSMNSDDRATWFSNSLNLSRALKREITTAPVDDLLQQYIEEQYHLITSLPSEAARRIENIVLGNLYKGVMRSKTLAELIYQTGDVTKARARLIARTEISKMSTGLTKVRSEVLGLDWYIWKATHDIRVRDSHKFMHNVVCNWNDPPNPEKLYGGKQKPYGKYHAGITFNCRCFADPLLRMSDVSSPVRVHQNGKITTMNGEQFRKLIGGDPMFMGKKN